MMPTLARRSAEFSPRTRREAAVGWRQNQRRRHTVKGGDSWGNQTISVKTSDTFQTAAEDNWLSVMTIALKGYFGSKSKVRMNVTFAVALAATPRFA
jgi:hypothetical protein